MKLHQILIMSTSLTLGMLIASNVLAPTSDAATPSSSTNSNTRTSWDAGLDSHNARLLDALKRHSAVAGGPSSFQTGPALCPIMSHQSVDDPNVTGLRNLPRFTMQTDDLR